MELNNLMRKKGRFCLINVSDLIDIGLVMMLMSNREDILENYVDLFPDSLSQEDVEYYIMDCMPINEQSEKVLRSKLDYFLDLLMQNGKWVTA